LISSDTILERASELKRQGVPFVLATVVRCESPTSSKPGAKAIVAADGGISGWIGGGCAQPAVIATARKALADGQPRLIRVSPNKDGAVEEGVIDFGMSCHSGGTLDIFLEPFGSRPRLLIIGAAPSAEALAGLASRTGFEVSVASPGVDAERFPEAGRVIDSLEPSALAAAAPDFVVVATQGKRDESGLEAALASGAAYVTFIASARKADKLRSYLRERGQDPQRVAAIVSPAGIEIGAVSPEEIALSVLAALVKARREGVAAGASARSSAPPPSAPEATVTGAGPAEPQPQTARAGGSAIDPVCGMSVEVAGAEFRSEYRGQSFYFCCAGCQHSFDQAPEKFLTQTGARG
jgi:xanthine dehydrogenase accessory factor